MAATSDSQRETLKSQYGKAQMRKRVSDGLRALASTNARAAKRPLIRHGYGKK